MKAFLFENLSYPWKVNHPLSKKQYEIIRELTNKAKSYQFGGYSPDYVKVAYIVYALSEAGIKKEITKEISAVYKDNSSRVDGYTNALCGISLYNVNDAKKATEMSTKLSKNQHKDGYLESNTTICGSGGKSKLIEATALAGSTDDFGNVYSSGTTFGTTLSSELAVSATAGYQTFTIQPAGKIAIQNQINSGILFEIVLT